MRERIAKDYPFQLSEVTREEAKGLFADQPYKQEIIADLAEASASPPAATAISWTYAAAATWSPPGRSRSSS